VGYKGNERRIHKVFVTRNTEYHVRRTECVGVRDRRTGEWLRSHMALKSEISGGLKFLPTGGIRAVEGTPRIGESLFFIASGRDVVTSPVVSIERPERATVSAY
jgi:hypothetical protein